MQIVLPQAIADDVLTLAQAAAPRAKFLFADEHGQVAEPVDQAEVLLRWFFKDDALNDLVSRMSALRWLHIPQAGVESTLVPAVMERDLLITNSAGVHAAPIAEFVMMFVLDQAKQSARLRQFQAERTWGQKDMKLSELSGKTMLILGLGQIGQAVAQRAKAFDMTVWGSRRSGKPVKGMDRVVNNEGWRGLLGDADYIVVAAPSTPATRGMLGAAEFAAMRPDAYLVNIARGDIIVEDALIAALRDERIAGAGLDVFAHEPLPSESPLWALPNVFATPHISWSSPEIRPRTMRLFAENLRRFIADEPLRNVVDKHAGY